MPFFTPAKDVNVVVVAVVDEVAAATVVVVDDDDDDGGGDGDDNEVELFGGDWERADDKDEGKRKAEEDEVLPSLSTPRLCLSSSSWFVHSAAPFFAATAAVVVVLATVPVLVLALLPVAARRSWSTSSP